MSTELIEVSKAVAEFDRVGAGLAALREKYASIVFDVTATAGMNDAKAARLEIRQPRYEIERIRKAAKAPILALGKKLDTEAARITEELEKLEQPIDSAIKAEDERKEREKQAKIEAEQKRVADLQERVAELRGNQMLSPTSGSELIIGHLTDLEMISIDDSFEEFRQQAEDAKAAGLARLHGLLTTAQAHEVEQARIKVEREELARLRKAEEERQAAERARISEEEKAAKATRDAEAAKQAEALRLEREAQAAETARQRAKQITAAKIELERIAEENRKLAEARAEIALQQEELRKAQEPPPVPPPPPPAPVSRRGISVPVPTQAEIVGVLVKHYRAQPDTIIEWLRTIDWSKAEAA